MKLSTAYGIVLAGLILLAGPAWAQPTFTITGTVTATREGYVFSPESLMMTFPGTGTAPVFDASMVATSTQAGHDVPATFALEQNYPNPFNPETVIRYHLAEAGPVRLDVVDLLGRTVAVLVDARHRAGTHTAVFDAGPLPAGLYFYRLHTASTTLARIMVLAK